MRCKKILFSINDYDFFISHRYPIAAACIEKGWEVHIATPQKYEATDDARKRRMIWHGLSLDAGSYNPVKDFIFLRELTTLYKSLQPDIIHHVTIKAVLYGSIAARLAKVPAVVNALSGLGYLYINNDFKTKIIRGGISSLFKWGFNHPNSFLILQNSDDKSLVLDYGLIEEDRIVLIRGSGVNIEKFKYVEESVHQIKVVLPGRMLWDKGVGEFIEAAKILIKNGTDATFHLLGRTDSKNPQSIPERQLQEWNAEPKIYYEGHQEGMVNVFRDANIVCLPSYREGLPKALLEAAATGRAIVTTDAPGCREVVQDGWNGYLVPVKSVDRLVDRLEKLINDFELRRAFGKRGRMKVVEEFGIELVVEDTMRVYGELIKQRGFANPR